MTIFTKKVHQDQVHNERGFVRPFLIQKLNMANRSMKGYFLGKLLANPSKGVDEVYILLGGTRAPQLQKVQFQGQA